VVHVQKRVESLEKAQLCSAEKWNLPIFTSVCMTGTPCASSVLRMSPKAQRIAWRWTHGRNRMKTLADRFVLRA
jgi:hypothetical protein